MQKTRTGRNLATAQDLKENAMTKTYIEKARYGRIIAVQAMVARKSGTKPKAVSLDRFKSQDRFQPVEQLMAEYDEIENIFAVA